MNKDIIEKYMKIAIEEAEKSKKNGENPFGAVLLDPEYNFCHKSQTRCNELSDPTAHAETLVIREYCKKINSVYLKDYILICSGEPCILCSGAIRWAKIQTQIESVMQEKHRRKFPRDKGEIMSVRFSHRKPNHQHHPSPEQCRLHH
jgi:tRNA(Arg) A34 adenosine deaminase TadA